GDGNQAFATLSVEEGKVIIHKTSDATPSTTLGNTITYSFQITNTGTSTISSFTVTDTKLGAITCPVSSLAPGASTTCTATHVVTQADLNAGSVTNVATASVGSATPPTDTVTVNAQAPKLTLVKTVINDNGGTKQVADFPLFVNGSPVTTGVANTLS